jgi:hypothetical protein
MTRNSAIIGLSDGPNGDGRSPSGPGSRASHEAADASSPKASIPSAEVGFVEYRSIFHALWKEGLSTYRSWQFARRTGRGPQQWYGVYVGGTEIRLAAVGPWSLTCAEMIASAIEARRAETLGSAAVARSSLLEAPVMTATPLPNEADRTHPSR